MNLKKFALRGMMVLAAVVALCMFFSGTIKTITTAKISITQGRYGRLEETYELSGKLTFTDVTEVAFELEEGQLLSVTRVNVRPGYTVAAGDVVVEARVANFEETMQQYRNSYDQAMDGMLQLESRSGDLRVRRTDEVYADCYFALREAKLELVSAKVDMEALLISEGLTVDSPAEEMSEEAAGAVLRWKAAAETEAQAQADMDAAERYKPDDAVWNYISEKRGFESAMNEAEEKMRALSLLNGGVQAIRAPHDGYIAEVAVTAGQAYDGTSELFTMSSEGVMPVLRADISELERTVTEGTSVGVSGSDYGYAQTKVIKVGVSEEGGRYADVEITREVIEVCGSIYSMTLGERTMQLVYRAQQNTNLLPVSAVRGTGEDRYVFTVEKSYSSFGNSRMTVRKTPVTVLAEANGMVSVQEELGYYDIAYMEDRPINDGDTVMLYNE